MPFPGSPHGHGRNRRRLPFPRGGPAAIFNIIGITANRARDHPAFSRIGGVPADIDDDRRSGCTNRAVETERGNRNRPLSVHVCALLAYGEVAQSLGGRPSDGVSAYPASRIIRLLPPAPQLSVQRREPCQSRRLPALALGCGFAPALPDVAVMLGEGLGEDMSAGPVGNKIKIVG